MKKTFFILAILLLLTGGCASRTTSLTESNAIQQALLNHPDFPPISGETKMVRLPTGGPVGSTSMVEYITTAEKISEGNYQITLTKDWHLVVNGQKVISYWKYNVGSNGVTLIASEDRDSVPNQMK